MDEEETCDEKVSWGDRTFECGLKKKFRHTTHRWIQENSQGTFMFTWTLK